jgi:formamidopyrimidine-DNA glycosylase
VVCGIGNWLADEILYQTQLHPESACSALSPVIVNQLRESIHRILEIACDVDSDLDQMPADWLVHYRWSKRAKTTVRTADGHPIKFITVGGRTSAVCLSRQRLIRSSIAGIGSRKQSQEDEKRLTDNQPQVFEKRKVDKVPSARQKSERIAAVVAKRKEIP